MLAIKNIIVSISYGSPATAFVTAICIKPWLAIGASQEYALSILKGFPSSSIARSSGSVGKPNGKLSSGCPGTTFLPGFIGGTICLG